MTDLKERFRMAQLRYATERAERLLPFDVHRAACRKCRRYAGPAMIYFGCEKAWAMWLRWAFAGSTGADAFICRTSYDLSTYREGTEGSST